MFERYTEKARRVIFFARYEASESGLTVIEPEHLLLGLLRESHNLFKPPLDRTALAVDLRQRVRTPQPAVPTSVDLPLSNPSKRALAYAGEEAQTLRHTFIGTEHLLLGLLREKSVASEMLVQRGFSLEALRTQLRQTGPVEMDSARAAQARQAGMASSLPVMPLTPSALHAFAHAMEAAEAASQTSLSPECLLYGLLHDEAGSVASLLKEAAVDLEALRVKLRGRLGSSAEPG